MQNDPPREREGNTSRVPTPIAMRARDVSRPSEVDLAAAEAAAERLIESRLSGRSPRHQARGSGTVAHRS
jgi:hypothetical protein